MNPRRPVAPGPQAASTSLQCECSRRAGSEAAICLGQRHQRCPVQHVAPPRRCCTQVLQRARPDSAPPRQRSGCAEAGRVEVEAAAPALDLHPRHAHLPRHRTHVPVVRAEQLDELRPARDVRLAERTNGVARHRVRPRLGRGPHDLGKVGGLDASRSRERHRERQRLLEARGRCAASSSGRAPGPPLARSEPRSQRPRARAASERGGPDLRAGPGEAAAPPRAR